MLMQMNESRKPPKVAKSSAKTNDIESSNALQNNSKIDQFDLVDENFADDDNEFYRQESQDLEQIRDLLKGASDRKKKDNSLRGSLKKKVTMTLNEEASF